ncbi:MAG TPA: enterotoxin [Gemmatimonadaceae bacterium]|nr:enterotoxin [Gemmatimonadaceae bacterium]
MRPPRRISRRAFVEQSVQAGLAMGFAGACRHAPSTSATPLDELPARFRSSGGELTLYNDALSASWRTDNGALRGVNAVDALSGSSLTLPESGFSLLLADGSRIDAAAMRLVRGPTTESLGGRAGASRAAERVGGRGLVATLEDRDGRVRATWRASLRDGSRYVRQEVTLEALGQPLAVRRIVMIDAAVPDSRVSGTVRGSPIVAGNWYMGFEHPLAASSVDAAHALSALDRELPLRPGAPVTASSVVGLARAGQLRRDFLAYVERERAHPYRTFLHYNSWYDLGYFSKYSEPGALAVIDAFGTELVKQRGVVMSSFLFDDGWDDPATLWSFHSGFPDGFTRVRAEAAKYGAAPGVWLSPWGGYGKPKEERLANGRAQGFETNARGFALSGPKYYARFRETCLKMIHQYGVNQFKIDGTGNAASAFPGSAFDSDFDAAIALIGDLRAAEPDLYVNLTTGTYPSPFWLRYADSIWRGGEDHSFAGVGSDRQQWITYRDGDTFRGIVSRGPLFPLNSLMLHGLIYAVHANKLNTDPHDDFGDEIRAYFGTGTQLQEMYVTPSLLTPRNWDTLAEAARWSRGNAGTLVDTHWVGGDPRQLQPYGHAAWSPEQAVLSLRNPSDRPQPIDIDLERTFELPAAAAASYSARSPWAEDRGRMPILLRAGTTHRFELAPLQVLTLDLTPV